jgi:hypothetical protein
MARWKLLNAHYLNTRDPTEWEYQETDRTSGRPVRKKFIVPRLLDPREPSDWNHSWGHGDQRDGDVIVCLPGKGDPKDIEFLGDPTPDMLPLDDEAKSISASFAEHWRFKAEGQDTSYSQSLVDKFQSQMAEHEAKPSTVQVQGLDALIAAMATQSAAIQALLTSPAPRRI